MDRLIASNSVPLAQADTAPASGTPQYATDGNPAAAIPATLWPAYAFNALQDEIYNVIVAAGLTPNRNAWNQLLAAIQAMLQNSLNTYDGFVSHSTSTALAASDIGPLIGATNVTLTLMALSTLTNGESLSIISTAGAGGATTINTSGTDKIQMGSASLSTISVPSGQAVRLTRASSSTWLAEGLAVGANIPLIIAAATANNHAVQLGQLMALLGGYSAIAPFNTSSPITNAVVNQIVEWTGAVGTLTLADASTFSVGEKVRISNLGTGMLTVAVASGDSIQFGPSSVTTMTVPPGLDLELTVHSANQWDATGGSCLPSGVLIKMTSIDFTGTWTPDPRTKAIYGKMTGGGGAGGSSPVTGSGQIAMGGGGGSGAWCEFYMQNPGVQSVSIGSGGTPTSGSTGGTGGATQFSGMSCPGGTGGPASGAVTFTGAAPYAGKGNGGALPANVTGMIAAGSGQDGGFGVAWSIQSLTSGYGGQGIFPAGGGSVNGSAGQPGVGAGCGGSGAGIGQSTAANLGGAGNKGKLIIWEYM
ncbi:hypothetical protein [Paraburkholderia solisilvae]|uniref:Tail fiber protein n=1 Tax=Paraburkholderia solisilvae TaxID=624376 RepID=A0A6J5DZ05_9BURK|nr:hypothetical protein [Paraburkholderia solisilvae]CAB3759389.1 hypothetical protein LMG29739_03141 [Paraburkholderia solisilvae]